MGSSRCSYVCFESCINPSAISSHLLKNLEISTEPLVGRRTVLKAFEIGFQLERRLRGKAINHPCPVPGALDHALFAEVGEMLGNLGLRKAQNFLEMADAKRTLCQQMDDSQPRGIAETLVNLNQLHARNIATVDIFVNLYIRLSVCFLRRAESSRPIARENSNPAAFKLCYNSSKWPFTDALRGGFRVASYVGRSDVDEDESDKLRVLVADGWRAGLVDLCEH